MNPLQKLWAGDPFRKSRMHDEQGNLAGGAELATLPRRVAEYMGVRRGIYPKSPWWPSAAAKRIEQLLDRSSTVVEFGSGTSTAWLAARAGQVVSIEHDTDWFERVSDQLGKLGNVNYVRRGEADYTNVPAQAKIDLVIVDGLRRADCIDWSFSHVAPGGWIYLDNSDADKDHTGGPEERKFLARKRLLDAKAQGKVSLEVFRGFPPANLAATEGMLALVL